jgi:hypothetical protein
MSTEKMQIKGEEVAKYLLDDVFKIHNQANGDGYTIDINGKRKRVKTTDELVNQMFINSTKIQGDDMYVELVKYINFQMNEEHKSFEETWKKYVKMMVQAHIQKKAEFRDEIIKESIPSAFGAEFNECKFLPRGTLNQKDLEILKGLAFCPKSQFFFFEFHGNWTRLGTAIELQDKTSLASIRAAILISKANAERRGVQKWDIWDEHYRECDRLTAEFMDIRLVLERVVKEKLTFDITVKPFWSDTDISLRDLLQLPEGVTATDVIDKLHSAICKVGINQILSAVMINKGLGNINYEFDGEWFKRYSYRPKGKGKCSLPDYLAAAFSEVPSLIEEIPILNEEPRVISDIPGVRARFTMKKDWLNTLPEGQKPLKECKALKSFLAPYTQNEVLAMMAFAYTVIHPSTNDPINLCIKTGGGTFKTSTFAGDIVDLMNYAYRPDGSIVHKMVGDAWVVDSARLENANGDGVSTAALVFNDECTEKGINKFKDMSGASTDVGVDYQRRLMHQNPVEMKIYAKWLFLTNIDFQIQDTEGAFERRLGIIDEMKIKKLTPPYPRESYDRERKRELRSFYELSKKCYDKVVAEHGSLTTFFQECPELNKNLRQAYNEEAKLLTYHQIWQKLQGLLSDPMSTNSGIRLLDDGSIGVASKSIDDVMKFDCEENGVNLSGMKKWIANTECCEGINNTKYRMRFNKYDLVRGYRLYKLKKEFIPVPDMDFYKWDSDPEDDALSKLNSKQEGINKVDEAMNKSSWNPPELTPEEKADRAQFQDLLV